MLEFLSSLITRGGFRGRQVSRATKLKKAERTENKIFVCAQYITFISFSENNNNFGCERKERKSIYIVN